MATGTYNKNNNEVKKYCLKPLLLNQHVPPVPLPSHLSLILLFIIICGALFLVCKDLKEGQFNFTCQSYSRRREQKTRILHIN